MAKLPEHATRTRKTAARQAATTTVKASVARDVASLPDAVRDELAARMIAVQSAALAATLDREAGVPASKTDVSKLVAAFTTSDGKVHAEALTVAALRDAAGGTARLKSLGVPESISVAPDNAIAAKNAEAASKLRIYRRGRSTRFTALAVGGKA